MQKILALIFSFIQLISVLAFGDLPFRTDNGETEQLQTASRCEERAYLLADSYYNNCYIDIPNRLIMYVDRFDTTASCWEYCGLLSLSVAMAKLDSSYLTRCESVVDGLKYYRHTNTDGSFSGYAVNRSEVKNFANEKIAYDDNMWLCRDLIELFEMTQNAYYLDLAEEIADFIIAEGYTDIEPEVLRNYGFSVPDEVGGFYWDYRHDALHACSNGPAVQCLAALYRLTGNESYLDHAVKSYSFLKCLVNDDGVFYDLMAFEKDGDNNPTSVMGLSDAFYSYNSGSPITGAVELYRATGDEAYLSDASYWADSAYDYYAADTDKGVKQYPTGNSWFNLILLNGFRALLPYDEGCAEYIDSFLDSIDYAYDNHRSVKDDTLGGTFLPRAWADGFTGVWEDDYNSLTVSANAEVYAGLALYYAS